MRANPRPRRIERVEVDELLRRVRLTDADANPLVAKLILALEDYLDDEDERADGGSSQKSVQDEESPEAMPSEEYEEGRRHGLETACSLIETEERALQEMEADTQLAEASLDRVAREIQTAQKVASTEYVEAERLDTRSHRSSRARPEGARKAAAPLIAEPATLKNKVLAMLPRPGDSATRSAITQMLTADPAVSASNAGNVLKRLIDLGQLERQPGRVLARVR